MNDTTPLSSWIGRFEEAEDVASRQVQTRLAAVLDYFEPPWPADQLPPLAHWFHFVEATAQSQIGADGHPKRGAFLPPVALPRRMYAGSRLEFLQPIRLGEPIKRRSTIKDIQGKSGAAGDMVFVTILHEISTAQGVAITEEQDIVYRSSPDAGGAPSAPRAPKPAPPEPDARRTTVVDTVMLFRFSALAFTGHRIHYDQTYATHTEGYPGLLIHGPLIATLLLDHFLRLHPGATPLSYQFRAKQPLFVYNPVEACLRRHATGADLWAPAPDGGVAMQASVTCA